MNKLQELNVFCLLLKNENKDNNRPRENKFTNQEKPTKT